MSKIKGEEIDLERLVQIIKVDIDESEVFYNSQLKTQMEKGYERYYGQPFGNEKSGRSQHMSMDIFNSVESTKALLLETFSYAREPVKFLPTGPNDSENAKQASAYVAWNFYRKNSGYKILHDVIFDALVTKLGIVKRYWKQDWEISSEKFSKISEDELTMLLNKPESELVTLDEETIGVGVANEMGQAVIGSDGQPMVAEQTVYTGEVKFKFDTSRVAVEVLPPEDFLIDNQATDFDDFLFCAQRDYVTKSQLNKMGFDPEIVGDFRGEESIAWLEQTDWARNSVDETFYQSEVNAKTEEEERVWLYEVYRKIDLDGDGVAELYQIYYAKNKILQLEIVEEVPFRSWSCFPIAHKFYGLSMADVLHQTQKSKSSLYRMMMDNLQNTNTSRYVADLAYIKNPKDLIDNKIGAVIDTTNMDAVRPLTTPQLNPTTFSVFELLNQEKEEISGNSRLSQGLNEEALSKQNSADMISALTSSSNRRTMMMAKNFAENFLKPLFMDIYKIAMKHDKKETFIMLNDQYVPVNPQALGNMYDLEVKVALTPEEGTNSAQELLLLHNTMLQTPSMQEFYGPMQQRYLFEKAMSHLDVACRDKLLIDPRSEQYQQQKQMEAQQAQKMEQLQEINNQLDLAVKQGQANLLNSQAESQKFNSFEKSQDNQEKAEMEKMKLVTKTAMEERRQEHQEFKDGVDISLEEEELDLKQMEINKKYGVNNEQK